MPVAIISVGNAKNLPFSLQILENLFRQKNHSFPISNISAVTSQVRVINFDAFYSSHYHVFSADIAQKPRYNCNIIVTLDKYILKKYGSTL